MGWFSVYKNEYVASSGQNEEVLKKLALKRIININSVKENISAGEQVYINLGGKYVNKYINSSLVETTDNYSYVVILEDYTDSSYFVPVKSRITSDNILYFLAEEAITKDEATNKYYAIYYGLTGVKNLDIAITTLDSTPTSVWSIVTTTPPSEGLYFDIASANINYYTKSITESTEGSYTLAFYNSGTDWESGQSKKIGAKAFGVFWGPRFRVIGPKSNIYGKFKIRIFPYVDEEKVSSTPIVDWTEIDCYSQENLSDQTLYSKTDLDYQKYIFEIETLSTKNIMALSNDVKIDKYEFTPNYGLTYEEEVINPSLAFITIAGVR